MARVICIYNAKGYVGKTTTAMNLSAYLAMTGRKTLNRFRPAIQRRRSASAFSGRRMKPFTISLAGQAPERAIRTPISNLQMIPASPDLAGALVELVNLPDREWYLKNFIEKIRNNYEFILIDLGPSLNLLTVNGLASADEVLVPVQCEYYSLEGLSQLLESVDLVKNNLGHEIKSVSALLTMYDKRERLSREIAREVRKRFPYKVFEVEIPRSVSLAEAPSFQKPIMLYAPQSPGALAYERLAREIIEGKAVSEGEVFYPQEANFPSFDIGK